MSIDNDYPYRITYPRDGGWYESGGTWYQLSTWCDETYGVGKWEYYFNAFHFQEEQDKMIFMLKWNNRDS